MSRWVKFICGLLLLPAALGGVRALIRVTQQTGQADTIWVAVLGGAACWWVIFLMLPRPLWIYVVGHELTHAVWTWAFGGKVKRFKVRSSGGHVVITKTNWVIELAPYFFPLYLVGLVLLFGLTHWLWPGSWSVVWFHFFIGVAYAFHVTLTWHVLQTRQTDITRNGYLFSAVIIALGNLAVLLWGIPLLTNRVGVLTACGLWLTETGRVLQTLGRTF